MDAPVAQPAPPSPALVPHIERFEFRASGAEYFRIWIVNLALTIATLGIYSAWAKVRRLRYFYGSTVLAGSSFEYHGQPKQILKGRMIAASLLVPYFLVSHFLPPWQLVFLVAFAIALPFLVVKSRLFSSRMTSWRNIRFDFTGGYRRAAGVYLGHMLLTVVTLGLAFPYWIYTRQRFLISETRLGATPFEFRARLVDYYVAAVLAGLIIAGGALIATFGAGGIALLLGLGGASAQEPGIVLTALIGGVPILLAYLLGFAYMNARLANAAFGNTHIGEHKLACALQARRLFWLYLSNAVAAVVSLGLLIPWAQVRLARYQLENMSLEVSGSLDEFAGSERERVAATGEELSDLIDVDFGL